MMAAIDGVDIAQLKKGEVDLGVRDSSALSIALTLTDINYGCGFRRWCGNWRRFTNDHGAVHCA